MPKRLEDERATRIERALGIGNPAFLKIRRRFLVNGTRRLRESKTRPREKKEDGTQRRPPKD